MAYTYLRLGVDMYKAAPNINTPEPHQHPGIYLALLLKNRTGSESHKGSDKPAWTITRLAYETLLSICTVITTVHYGKGPANSRKEHCLLFMV